MKRKISIVSGSRAEYGYLKPLIEKIENDKELGLLLYIAGMHLVKEYGYTIDEIRRDGFDISDTIDMEIKKENSPKDLANSIGIGIIQFSRLFLKDKPEIIIVFGDRIEPLAATIAASVMNIPVAHIGGGDTAMADIDNNIRHAITKFSHLHFTASQKSMERVLKLGEESWRVFNVGALSLDTLLKQELLTKEQLKKKYNIFNQPYILISFHPSSIEWRDSKKQIENVMDAACKIANQKDFGIILIYPNAYPGGFQILKVIKQYAETNQNILLFENFPHIDYGSLMYNSIIFVGNSSSGIIEAPSLGVPYVCVGNRQFGRERANNVIDVDYDKEEILIGINNALSNKEFLEKVKKCESPYGNGTASEKILKILKNIEINDKLIKKKMTY
ncbi:MAG: UDP-N-acetylglucosamine 2-epimerase [Candidatus Hodarchaeota archaeon]